MNINELQHFGILGMKWGVRRYQNKDGSLTPAGKKKAKNFTPTGVRAAMAKRANRKVDKGFENWQINAKKKEAAIDLGKKATASKMAYEKDNTKENKDKMNADKKAYKKALSSNTTYRKGAIRGEVGKDLARKYMSEAKAIKKKLDASPDDKQLRAKYNALMSKQAITREKARRAPIVGQRRSNRIAALKRAGTMTVKAAAATAAIGVGVHYTNKYLASKGKTIRLNSETVRGFTDTAKKVRNALGYFY